MDSKRIPTRFSSFIMLWVTLFGKVCTRTNSRSGRYCTQMLSVLLPESQRNTPSPPFSKTVRASAAAFSSITPFSSSISKRFPSYIVVLPEPAITVPSAAHKNTSADLPKYVVFSILCKYSSAK